MPVSSAKNSNNPDSSLERVYKPNFFIIGAAKSGTSSLWGYLNEHPEIFMSIPKEPGYFAPEWPGPKEEGRYLKIFQNAQSAHKRIGEASTMYLSCPGTAEQILTFCQKNQIKDPKLVVMLRNPADRAYSLYNWQVQEGYEYAGSFEKAISLEENRRSLKFPNPWLTGGYKYNYMYFHSGLYADQIQDYVEKFGKENLHVLIFEEFIQDAPTHLKEIYDFLGLELKDFLPEIKVYNPSYEVYSPLLQFGLRWVNRATIEKRPIRWFIKSKEQRDTLINLGHKKNKPPKLDPAKRKTLLNKYMSDIQKLEQHLDRDLSIWYR
ncbi:MAG: sulfotransferase [Bacteroidota bacterium]